MADEKMTRYQVMDAVRRGDWDALDTEAARTCADKYCKSSEKQAAKPKEKTQRQLENARIWKELLPIIIEYGKPFTATWAGEKMSNAKYGLLGAQRMSKGVLPEGEKANVIKRVRTAKNTWFLLVEWDETMIQE